MRNLLFVSFPRRPTSRARLLRCPGRIGVNARVDFARYVGWASFGCQRRRESSVSALRRLYFFPTALKSRFALSRKLAPGNSRENDPPRGKRRVGGPKSIASLSLVSGEREASELLFLFLPNARRGGSALRGFRYVRFGAQGARAFGAETGEHGVETREGSATATLTNSERRATARARSPSSAQFRRVLQ